MQEKQNRVIPSLGTQPHGLVNGIQISLYVITNSQETACVVTADSLLRKHSKVKAQQAGGLEAEQEDVCELQAILVCPASGQ